MSRDPIYADVTSGSTMLGVIEGVDPRVAALLQRFYEHFPSAELPIPVDSIAVDLLGLTVEEDDGLEVSGMLVPAEHQIWLNGREARQSSGRRRFTLAHELGHWICQHEMGRVEPRYCRSIDVGVGAGRELEWEANKFAAQLLMPESLIRREAGQLKLNVHAMARRFDVSVPAIKVRLRQLSLLPAYMQ